MLVCQLEAEMDDFRAQQKDDTHLELNWNDQLPSTDEEVSYSHPPLYFPMFHSLE